MVGYLRGPRIGAIIYNVVHDCATGGRRSASGWRRHRPDRWPSGRSSSPTSAMDRLAGYGLKLPTSFQDTHLGRIGQRRRVEPLESYSRSRCHVPSTRSR